jgi:hypothetical protein
MESTIDLALVQKERKKHKPLEPLIYQALEALEEERPQTARQVHYVLLTKNLIENNLYEYKRVCKALAVGRKKGIIPWGWVEDRMRIPHTMSMWDGPQDLIDNAIRVYKRDVWETQPTYIEVWIEKDALSSIFSSLVLPYGISLQVNRGYASLSALYEASRRLDDDDVILYWGDHDPSGKNMETAFRNTLAEFGCRPEVVRCAIFEDDIDRFNLPSQVPKKTDTRTNSFVRRHGNRIVELDALPKPELRRRIKHEIESRLDMDALNEVRRVEAIEHARLVESFSDFLDKA